MIGGLEVRSCADVPRGRLRLVAADGSTRTIPLDGQPIPDTVRWRRFEMNPSDYEALSKQVKL